ncbi:MAG: protein kinase [Deltaproteobacteria bacterium]|nr:protein kinase [Deltaproteobacteria bacterium]
MRRCEVCHAWWPDDQARCGDDDAALQGTDVYTLADVIAQGPTPVRGAVRFAARLAAEFVEEGAAQVAFPDVHPLEVELPEDDGPRRVLVRRRPREVSTERRAPFSAPERLRGEDTSPATTVYNVVAILYALLTGRPPFEGASAAAVVVRQSLEAVPSVRMSRGDVPKALDEVVLRGLSRDPAARPANVGALLVALDRVFTPDIPTACAIAACVPEIPLPVAAASTASPPQAGDNGECRRCGKLNARQYRFCLGCGSDLRRDGEAAPRIAPNSPAQRSSPMGPLPGGEPKFLIPCAPVAPIAESATLAAPSKTSWFCGQCGRENRPRHRFCLGCGHPSEAPPPPSGPRPNAAPAAHGDAYAEPFEPFWVGPYHCAECLGEGGMGVVYRGRHRHLGRWCAVKVLLPSPGARGRATERFFREARIAATISHPNVVTVYDFGQADGALLYLAMEYLPGRTLAQELADGPIPLPRCVALLEQVCEGLGAAHAAGVIHRDLKPHNIMVTSEGPDRERVKLLDFGVACSAEGDAAHALTAGEPLGTPLYMAPEQARGEPSVDHRADLFSLAVVAYQLLSGRLPFHPEPPTTLAVLVRRASLSEPPVPLRSVVGERIPPAVDALLAQALHPDADARFRTAAAFFRAFRGAASARA